MATNRSRRSVHATQIVHNGWNPSIRPSLDEYAEPKKAIWNPDLVVYAMGDHTIVAELFQKDAMGKLIHPAFHDSNKPVQRAINAYTLLPLSYRNRIWRVEVDGLTPNYKDSKLAPDTDFLPNELRKIWTGFGASDCETKCPSPPGCPWIDDCAAFDDRKERWDRAIEQDARLRSRWEEHKAYLKGAAGTERRKETVRINKEQIQARMREKLTRSSEIFHPKEFENKDHTVKHLMGHIRRHRGPVREPIVERMMEAFPATTVLTFLDIQCLIADYFHDGLPGFRITSTRHPKISGIDIYDPSVIDTGKTQHQAFMYDFLEGLLTKMRDAPESLPERLRDPLLLQELQRRGALALPRVADQNYEAALDSWRQNALGLEGRIEDSLSRVLGLSHVAQEGADPHFHLSLDIVGTTDPMILYDRYLESGRPYVTIHIRSSEVFYQTFRRDHADRILHFLLLVLFGPRYTDTLQHEPALFTFDAHKGHVNRILARSSLLHVYRLITPYNVADSAMTEKFETAAMELVDDETAAQVAEMEEEVIQEALRASGQDRQAKEEAVVQEDETGEEEVDTTAFQRGHNLIAFSAPYAPLASAVAGPGRETLMSDTHMIFDDNWLIYYKDMGFSKDNPYGFSMNLVDAGLHQYIRRKNYRIPSSFYTVEAPFHANATRGPSLNYLMLGLLRGTTSSVWGARQPAYATDDELYERLCGLSQSLVLQSLGHDHVIKKLLPIYTIPASSKSLPLFQHIAQAPLFAYHMLYDLQHRRSALPSRIKWAGDREQYMALKDAPHGVFVTLDTTGSFCALANGISSILERKQAMILKGASVSAQDRERVKVAAAAAPKGVIAPTAKRARAASAFEEEEEETYADPNENDTNANTRKKRMMRKAAESQAKTAKAAKAAAKKRGGQHAFLTRKRARGGNPKKAVFDPDHAGPDPAVFDRDYFFLPWLGPIVMYVNEAYRTRHRAEQAYVALQDLQDVLDSPRLFPILQEQLVHAVLRIPDVPKELVTYAQTLTAENMETIVPLCLALLEPLYLPVVSVFSVPTYQEKLTACLRTMRARLLKRYDSNDSTMNLLRTLLHPSYRDPETVCLGLALLFERLHGRVQRGSSYIGRVLGISGGPHLEPVDDQQAWESLTGVLLKDMAHIVTRIKPVMASAMASVDEQAVQETVQKEIDTPIKLPRPNAPRSTLKQRRVPLNRLDNLQKALKGLKPSKKENKQAVPLRRAFPRLLSSTRSKQTLRKPNNNTQKRVVPFG